MIGGVVLATVADQVIQELKTAGVDRIFGFPGGEVLPLMQAAHEAGIGFVLTRHESAAGMMAAVYGKIKRVPGVAIATLGPGAANLMLPVSNSLLDREPLLAISAQLPSEWPLTYTHLKIELEAAFRPVTKFAGNLRPGAVRRPVRQALTAAITEPAGPAYLTISAPDARSAAVPEPEVSLVAPSVTYHNAAAAAEEIARQVAAAKRPVVVAGLGIRPESSPAFTKWVESWSLPVLVTPKVKGVIDERHPNFICVTGGMAADGLARAITDEADLIIGFGFDPVECDPMWHTTRPILPVLESPNVYGLLPANALLVQHDDVLSALLERPAPATPWTAEALAELRRPFIAVREGAGVARTPGCIWPGDIVMAMRAGAPDDTILTTDVGAHKYLFGQYWPTYTPGGFWMSNGLSGMGYGLPAAIGAKLALPERPVIAVVGDGGFAMTSAELETAKRAGAPVVVVVLVDSNLGLISLAKEKRGYTTGGTTFTRPDCVALAKAWGADGVRVQTPEELTKAVESSLRAEGPVVIEVPVDYTHYKAMFS
jgi:acetolactate synthase-1/2/3 large subunit